MRTLISVLLREGFSMLGRGGYLASMMVVAVVCASEYAKAEVKVYSLKTPCSDFAFNHDTGDLAMVAPDKNEAWLIRSADLPAGKVDAPIKLKVGSSPSSIFYKKFKDTAVYAIVCSQDSHMYLMNAADGTLVKKIELAQSGVRHVTGSINPADPFVYYNYGAGHDCATGALILRTMQNQPLAFDDAHFSYISASGEVAYRLGPWSPSGFESLQRTTSLTDDTVAFARLFYDHDSKGGYVPDPFDRYTAALRSIYSRGLNKREADLTLLPQCFFSKAPVLVGYDGIEHFRNRNEGPQDVKLRAASYNTFSAFGDVVSFSVTRPAPRDNFGDLQLKERMFANDGGKQVIYAFAQTVALVPLADFAVPEEPFLLATLQGGDQAPLGKETQFSLKLLDSRVEVEVENMPEGMQAKGNNFTWTPKEDQVGPAQLAVMLKHKDIQRAQVFDLKVVRPSLTLPFAPVDLALSGDKKRMLIWEGIARDPYGQPQPPGTGSVGAAGAGNSLRMAVIDIANGAVAAEKKLKEPLAQVSAIGDFFVLLSANSPRCEVVRASDLERQKSLVANAPILSAELFGQMLVLQTQEALEIYGLPKLDRVAVMPNLGNTGSPMALSPRMGMQHNLQKMNAVIPQGLLAKGLLLDENLKTLLVLSPGIFHALPGSDANWRLEGSGVAAGPLYQPMQPSFAAGGQGVQQVSVVKLPNSSSSAVLEMRSEFRQVPGAIHTNRTEVELTLKITGDQPLRETILREERLAESMQSLQSRLPRLSVAGDYVFVIVDRRVYRSSIPKAEGSTKLSLTPKQSALHLSGQGTTTLSHEAKGGKGPYQFVVHSSLDGVSIDEKTGTVTLAEAALMEAAQKSVEQDLIRGTEPQMSYVDTYRNRAPSLIARGTEILGRKPTGYPVAIPIRVEVTDDEQASAVLQYFVIAELPSAPLIDRLKVLYEENKAKMAAAAPMPAGTSASGSAPGQGPANGDAELRRKVEALEERIDNLTRQLNEVLRRLDGPR
jgi:hypothetical protein